jgi:hypothetical protein
MVGVSLSRWTMSYFGAALAALLAAELLMALGFGFPAAPLRAPETLILVHIVAIGWLSLLMCGALLQFVPVLVASPLRSAALALPALLSLLGGLAAMILAFLQFGGRIQTGHPLFACASLLLGLGFGLVLWALARTLRAAPAWSLPAWFVVAGLASLVATASLGIIFALVHGGITEAPALAALAGPALPLHALAGFGGWLTFTAIGVSYRLLAMFMLAPELDGRRPKAALLLGSTALAVAILGGSAVILRGGDPIHALCLGGVLGAAALALYGADIRHLYRARLRRHIELNSRMAGFALGSLAAAMLLGLGLAVLGRLEDQIGALTFLLVFGWLSGLGLSKLFKIVAFITWLECYGPVLGRTATPRVQDLVVEARARPWFLLYFGAVWTGTALLLLGQPTGFRIIAALLLAATLGIVGELLRTRRLADIAGALRLPPGTRAPRLLFADIRKP